MEIKSKLYPYLFFDGNAEEAIRYYAEALELGEPEIMFFDEETAEDMNASPGSVLHASLDFANTSLYFSDDPMNHPRPAEASMYSLTFATEDGELFERAWEKFTREGTVVMAAGETFYAKKYGMVKDRFGILWHFMLDFPSENQI